jgi:hypothetical protein
MHWQEVTALGIVALTFGLMLRSGLRSIRLDRGRNCAGCSSCGTAEGESLNVPGKTSILSNKSVQESV